MQFELDLEKTRRRCRDALNKLHEGNPADVEKLCKVAEVLGVPVAEGIPDSELVLAGVAELARRQTSLPLGKQDCWSRMNDLISTAGALLPKRFEVWVIRDQHGERGRIFLNQRTAQANCARYGRDVAAFPTQLNTIEMRCALQYIKPYISLSEREIHEQLSRTLFRR